MTRGYDAFKYQASNGFNLPAAVLCQFGPHMEGSSKIDIGFKHRGSRQSFGLCVMELQPIGRATQGFPERGLTISDRIAG